MKKNETGLIVTLRKVVFTGNTYYISLPRKFIELHGIKKGEKLPIVADHILKIIPMKEV